MFEQGDQRVRLTEKQEQLRQIYEETYHYIRTFREFGMVVKKLLAHEEFGIKSATTAWKHINAALELYGNPLESRKESLRFLNTEAQNKLLDLQMTEIMRKRREKLDIGPDIEVASRIAERIARVNRLHEDESELPDFEKLKRTTVVVILPTPDQLAQYDDVMDIPFEVLNNKTIEQE